jgi:hypothetical protein
MCQVPHVAAHAAIVSTVLAAVEGLVCRVRAYFLKYAAQQLIGKSLELVGAVVVIRCGSIQVVPRARFALLGALLTPESLEEAHDAA